MTGSVIGYRADGRVIHLLFGAADDEGGDGGTGGGNAPEVAPPAPAQRDDSADLRAELDRLRQENATHQERLRALMAGDPAPQAQADPDDDEDNDDQGGKPADPELAKLRRAIRTANAEAKKRREREDRLRAEWEEQDRSRQAQLEEARRLSEAAEKARQEAESRYKPATIRAAAVPALLTAGAKPDRADRLVRLLDMDKLDVDSAGEVTGLAEQVAAVKQEWPELFATDEPQNPRPRIPQVNRADAAPVEDRPTRSADLIARQALRPAG